MPNGYHLQPAEDRQRRDRQWLREIREGREESFERLFTTYYGDLCSFACRYISSPAVAEDIVQDVFFNVWRRRTQLGAEINIRAYLYRAVRNEALKHLEHQEVRRRYEDRQRPKRPAVDQSSITPSCLHELKGSVSKALNALPDRRRQIYLLSREDNLTYREIAEVLGISVKTVETQMSRALQFLEDKLSRYLSMIRRN